MTLPPEVRQCSRGSALKLAMFVFVAVAILQVVVLVLEQCIVESLNAPAGALSGATEAAYAPFLRLVAAATPSDSRTFGNVAIAILGMGVGVLAYSAAGAAAAAAIGHLVNNPKPARSR